MRAFRSLLVAALAGFAGAASAAADPAADPAAGEMIYERCAGCHSLQHDRAGPRHCGLIGRRAGSVPGFGYSDAMKRSGLVWSKATLDRFLADPMRVVKGTAMGYAGVEDRKERADLIAYLEKAGKSKDCKMVSDTK